MLSRSYRRYNRRGQHRLLGVIPYLIAIAVLVVADQLTKLWALDVLAKTGSKRVIGDFLIFYFVTNIGAAFNSFLGQRVFLIAFSAVLSAVCVYFLLSRRLHSVLGDIALALITAGGIGNLIDRIFRGYVIDFIDFNAIHFAIFNVADSCVTVGAVLLIIFVLLLETKSGGRKSKSGIFTQRRF